jgi:iron complex outermembrane receptor protein
MRNLAAKLRSIGLLLLCTLLVQATLAQTATIKGTVKNSKELLEGASVVLEGKGQGTHTNTTGAFELKVKPGSYTLVISYVGHQKKTINVTVVAGDVKNIDVELEKDKDLQQVTVVGTRSRITRSNTQTVAPIDVFSARDLAMTGQVEPTQMLNYVAPSFNSSRQTVSDGTDHIDPATLRGLGPDQVLVLVNGQRRYNTALLNVNGTIGRGSVGTDLNSIPTSMIERIEVLRDGAASQYGSDAIAGVINIVLKRDLKKSALNFHYGKQYAGDGQTIVASGSLGTNLGKKGGFFDIGVDVRLRDATNRVGTYGVNPLGQYTAGVYYNYGSYAAGPTRDAIIAQDNALIASRGFSRDGNMLVGNSQSDNYSWMFNMSAPLSSKVTFSASGGTSTRDGKAAGFYRYPYQTSQVIAERYPDGFLPQIISDVNDGNINASLDGTAANGWKWNLANAYGGNSFQFTVANSNNASQYQQGVNAQTVFNAGKLKYSQNTTTFGITKDFGKSMNLNSFNFAAGLEHRVENYQIIAGEDASWKSYDASNTRAAGAQVFPGFQPSNAVNKNRYIRAGYVDVESDVNDQFMFAAALRYENNSDLKLKDGGLAGKLSARYKVSNALTFRGTVSNGFRAPSLQQVNFSAISTVFIQTGSGLQPYQQGTFKNGSDVANAFGIPALKPEKSVNLSLGATSKLMQNKLTITLDAYLIEIKDRIVLSSSFRRYPTSAFESSAVNAILNGFPSLSNISSAVFFANAIDTKTRGIDLVASYTDKVGKGLLTLTLAANYNKTELNGEPQAGRITPSNDPTLQVRLFGFDEVGRLEQGQPRDKVSLGFTHREGKVTANARVTRFGRVGTIDASNFDLNESFSPKYITDASLSYRLFYFLNLTVGANNIGDVYPDKLKNYANTGDGRFVYSRNATQFGFNGGYWYTNLAFDLSSIKSKPKPMPIPVAPVVIAPKPVPPKDTDGDGVPDKEDKCPGIAGVASLGGCPDKDGDGVTDAEDKCPSVAGIKMFGGCPDTDGDGIEDAKDKCLNKQGTAKYEGCPTPDTDGDGLNDDYDKCPTVPGNIANEGCPDKKAEAQRKVDKSAKEILFETGSAILKKSSNAAMDVVAAELAADANLSLEIEGHTDNVGAEKTNLKLSQARANAVKSYIVKKGIAANRVTATGFGSSQPMADNATAAGKAQNRRVVLKLK